MIYKLLIDLGISFMLSMVWAHMFTMILKFTGSKKAIGCVLSTFVVLEGGMMSLPVWSHVLFRGYNVTSCLVPCFFQGISGPRAGCLVQGVLVQGVLVSGGLVLGRVWSKGDMKLPLTVNRPSRNFVGVR